MQIIIVSHLARFKEQQESTSTKLEVAQLLCPFYLLARTSCDDRATDHHCAYTDNHDPAVADRVNGNQDTNVFAIHVKSRTDGHRVDCVILAFDRLGLAHDAVDRNMETVIILGGEAEDAKGAANIPLRILRVRVTQKPLKREFTALDPDGLCCVNGIEYHRATICGGDNDTWIIRSGARSCPRLQRSVKELVKVLEFRCRQKDFGHVQLVEGDEALNFGRRGRVIVFFALFETQRAK